MTDPVEPANLRFLRRLVTVLTAVMVIGVVVLVSLLVTRLSANGPNLPETIVLPDGSQATAFTQGDTWFAVVTSNDQILIYNRTSGQLRQTITLEPEN